MEAPNESDCVTISTEIEEWEKITYKGITMYQYDYQSPTGRLFSTVAYTKAAARKRRQEWQKTGE